MGDDHDDDDDDDDDDEPDDDDDDEDDKENLIEPFTEELKGLYFGKWETPSYLLEDDEDGEESELSLLVKIDHGNVSQWWYIYAIVISVVGLFVYNIIIGRLKFVKKVTGWNANDEYIAIP